MRHTLGHGPARRIGAPAPALLRNRAHQLVETRLRAAILVGDHFELRMHTLTWRATCLVPRAVVFKKRPGRGWLAPKRKLLVCPTKTRAGSTLLVKRFKIVPGGCNYVRGKFRALEVL